MNPPLSPRRRSLWLAVGVLAVLTTVVFGQDQPAPAVTVDFTAIALIEKPVTDLLYVTGGQATALKVPVFARSSGYKYTGPATMKLYRMQDNNGTKQPVEAGTVELPKGATRVLLVFAGAAPDYTIGALDDSGAGFGLGTARLCNATVFKLSLKCNDTEVVELAPGATKVLPAKNGFMGVEVSYFKDNRWVAATSNSYSVPPNGRLNVFLLTSGNNIRFIFPRAVQIFTLPEKAASASGASVKKP